MPMDFIWGLEGWRKRDAGRGSRTVVTIGNFDGVHLGHQRILRHVFYRAVSMDALSVVVTFDPHPLKILRPESAPRLLSTLPQRLARIEEMGIDATLVLPFTPEMSRLGPEEFVQTVLVDTLRVQSVLVGENFRFGHRQAGDVELLRALGLRHAFAVELVPPVTLREEIVSSTLVREAVRSGNVDHAARLLGRPFMLTGVIQAGTGIGRREVVPTLNLAPDQELLPANGVYITETWLPFAPGEETRTGLEASRGGNTGRVFHSVTNIGVRPTFDGHALGVETHLLDSTVQLAPGGAMGVSFWARLRDEKKFSGSEELRAQILRDAEQSRTFFRRLGKFRRHPGGEPAPD